MASALTATTPATTVAAGAIRFDSVAERYDVQDFSFEVNPENGRAGIRLEYTYPAARAGLDYSDREPAPRIAVLPGLTYNPASHTVVYKDGARSVTCATETTRRNLLWKIPYMKPTGACVVASRLTGHTLDDGWNIDRFRTVDTYFQVRR